MKIIAVDNDSKNLEKTGELIKKISSDAELSLFDSSLSALDHAREEEIDVVITDVDTDELSGLDLGRYLKELNPYVNIIYHCEQTDSAYDAMRLHASGYIKKPGKEEDFRNELESLRYPDVDHRYKRVFAQTFGNFELFVDGKPVEFKYKRTKEIVAVLINNKGAQTSNGEIIACLWEDDADPEKKMSYLSNLRQDLQNTFRKLKIDDILLKQRGSMAIVKDKIVCDLYDWLENKNDSKYRYTGDYMNQYSWSEFMHAELDEISYDLWDDEVDN